MRVIIMAKTVITKRLSMSSFVNSLYIEINT